MTGTFHAATCPTGGFGAGADRLMGGNHRPDVRQPAVVRCQHIKSGKLKALAVTSATRSSALPDLPTIEEAGGPALKGFEASSWFGLLAPAGTRMDIVNPHPAGKRQGAGLAGAEGAAAGEGAIPSGMTSAEFTRHIAAETAKWAKVVKAAGREGGLSCRRPGPRRDAPPSSAARSVGRQLRLGVVAS